MKNLPRETFMIHRGQRRRTFHVLRPNIMICIALSPTSLSVIVCAGMSCTFEMGTVIVYSPRNGSTGPYWGKWSEGGCRCHNDDQKVTDFFHFYCRFLFLKSLGTLLPVLYRKRKKTQKILVSLKKMCRVKSLSLLCALWVYFIFFFF